MNFFDLQNLVNKVKFVKVCSGHNTYIKTEKLKEALSKLDIHN